MRTFGGYRVPGVLVFFGKGRREPGMYGVMVRYCKSFFSFYWAFFWGARVGRR